MPGPSPHRQSVTMRAAGPAAAQVNRTSEIGARHSRIPAGLERKLAHRTTITPCSNRRSHRQRIAVNHMQRTNRSSRPRAHRYTISSLFGVWMTTALSCGSAGARDRPVPVEARQACTPDAFRLCGAHIPDEDAVAACLKANIQRLSVQCRQIISVRDAATGNGNPR